MREGPRHLVGARDSRAGDPVRRPADQLLTLEEERAVVGRVMAAHHIDEGRLAGPVRADKAEDLAAAHLEARVGQRLHALERLAHGAHHENRL